MNFRFPAKQDLRSKWMVAMRREGFVPTKHSRLCSNHFRPQDFRMMKSKLMLKDGAVPSVFDFPLHLQRPQRSRKPPLERKTLSNFPTRSTSSNSRSNILKEHNYCLTVAHSPRKMKRKVTDLISQNESLRRKLDIEVHKRRRMEKRIDTMHDVILNLSKEKRIDQRLESLLKGSFGIIPLAVFQRGLCAKEGAHSRERYPPDIRAFALTLQFHSTVAYEYLRKYFPGCLPRLSTLRSWYRSIDGSPGFTTKAFSLLKKMTDRW